jgi:hypothetical protein
MQSKSQKETILATVATVAAVGVTLKIIRPAVVRLSSRWYVQYLAKSKSSSEPEGSVSGLFIHPGKPCCGYPIGSFLRLRFVARLFALSIETPATMRLSLSPIFLPTFKKKQ